MRERGKKRIKLNVSDDEQHNEANGITKATGPADSHVDAGSHSDSSNSSSNELLEKCPICLLTFRKQEVGKPVTCEHLFCAACIEAWAKNVQTCPIDRLEFDRIIVLDTYERRNVVREVRIDLASSKKELVLDDENDVMVVEADDVTNCQVCNNSDREDIMLLCDSCNHGYHMDCLDPPLSVIPEGSWYCDNCFDSNDEDEDEELQLAEDLHTLYEDLRGMGLPETRLRVRQVQQPRILRTRQNERIRAAVLRHTRTRSTRAQTGETTSSTTTRNNRSSTQQSARTSTNTSRSRRGARRPRRTRRHRTYVVEYDLNNFDEKFAVKTAKKVIRRRRRRKVTRRVHSQAGDGVRLTASKRLAEQLGVRIDGARGSHINGSGASSFSLFGNANDLEYFSDEDNGYDAGFGGVSSDQGHSLGVAVQTTVRVASIGAPRCRKALLQGKARTVASSAQNVGAASDILSSIMDLQERWHDASRNLGEVHINSDGSLNLPTQNKTAKPTDASKPTAEHITQVPLYQRGGSTPNFGRGGGANGNYNNRYSGNNNGSYRSAGGGSGAGAGGAGDGSGAAANQYQRHSTGSDQSQSTNQSFNSNTNNSNTPNLSFTPFNIRFNTPNQQQQQQRNKNSQQSRTPSYSTPATAASPAASSFSHIIPQQPQRPLFGGLPGPIVAPALGPRISMPPLLSVPPPPTPPPSLSWNSSLFKINTPFANTTEANRENQDDDDDNCPNFSIYSQESQAVATELFAQPQAAARNSDKV